MRKQLFLAAAVIITPALLAFGQPVKDKQPGKPGAAPGAAPSTQPHSITGAAKPASKADDELTGMEEKIWGTIKNKDYTAFGGMLADDFMIIGNDGIHNKAECIDMVKKETLTSYRFSDWHVTHMGENAAIVMYKVEESWSAADGKANSDTAWCTSTWMRHGGKWAAVAHQESTVQAAAAK